MKTPYCVDIALDYLEWGIVLVADVARFTSGITSGGLTTPDKRLVNSSPATSSGPNGQMEALQAKG